MPQEIIQNLEEYLLASNADVLSADAIEQCIVRPATGQENNTMAKQIQVLIEDASLCEILLSLLALACEKGHPRMESLIKFDNALRLMYVYSESICLFSESTPIHETISWEYCLSGHVTRLNISNGQY